MLAPAILLCVLLILLSRSVQCRLRVVIDHKPALVFVAPLLLAMVFCAIATLYNCLSWRVMLLVLVYAFAPAACVYAQIVLRKTNTPSWLDFIAVLMLWLPLELSAGASLVPHKVQGVLHATA